MPRREVAVRRKRDGIFRVGSRQGRGPRHPVESVPLGHPGTALPEPIEDALGKAWPVEGPPAEDALPGRARSDQSLDRSIGAVGLRRPSLAVEERRSPRGKAVGLQPLGDSQRRERSNRHSRCAWIDPRKDDLVERRTGHWGAIKEVVKLTGTQRQRQRDGRGSAGRATILCYGQRLPCPPVSGRRNTPQTKQLRRPRPDPHDRRQPFEPRRAV